MVSVIVPIYNVEGYLTECLYSIANQTYSDIEVLCIDDCTMDNSVSIVNQFRKIDKRFKLLVHDKNRGLGGARNTGIKNAQGEYLLFVDSDDAIAPDMIEKLVSDIQSNQSDVSICAALEFYPDGTWNKNSTFHYHKYMVSFYQLCATVQDRLLLTNMWPSAWNKLFRADIVRKFNCSFPEKILYEDHSFYYSYFSHIQSFSYINDALYYYRKSRPGSITSNITGREDEVFKILKDIEEKFKTLYHNPSSNKDLHLPAMMKISYRLLAERSYVLAGNRKEWVSFSKKARAYLRNKYPLSDLKDNIDTFFDTRDEFYQYIFSNRIRIKISVKEFIKAIPGAKRIIRIVFRRGPIRHQTALMSSFIEYKNSPVLAASSHRYIIPSTVTDNDPFVLSGIIKRCLYYAKVLEKTVDELMNNVTF